MRFKKITAEEVIFYLETKEYIRETCDYVEGLLRHDSTPTYYCWLHKEPINS